MSLSVKDSSDLNNNDRYGKTTVTFSKSYSGIKYIILEPVSVNADWVGAWVVSHSSSGCTIQTYNKYSTGSNVSGTVRLYIIGI